MNAHKSHLPAQGFTLIELMVVVIIICILAAVALPSYGRQVQKTRRTDAQSMLMRVAGDQERYYTMFNRYTANLTAAPPAGLGSAGNLSENGFYTLTAAVGGGGQTYTLTATPRNSQAQDACKNLTMGSTGQKGFSGDESNGSCW